MSHAASVLVVDDSVSTRGYLRYVLEKTDCRVLDASHGVEGLEVFDRERPDLVLTDLKMPEMDGLSFIAELINRYTDVPVIVMSGKGSLDDGIEAIRMGAWDYLVKPLDETVLEAVINRSLDRIRLQEENRRYRELLENQVQARTRELSEERGRYQRLLESITSYVYTVSIREGQPVGTCHRPGCQQVTGYTPQDFTDDSDLWFRIVHQDDRDLVLDMARRMLETPENLDFEHRIIHKDGSVRWIRNTLVPSQDRDGGLCAYDGIIADITEKKRLESQLRQSQKMEAVGLLAGGIAHDLNNILTVIVGYESLLEMQMGEDDPLRVNVDEVLAAVDRAVKLTRSLLTFSREQEMHPAPESLNNLIRDVVKFLKRVIGEDIVLQTRLSREALHVLVDSGQMEQVLMNLATNARDAMPRGGRLVIETRESRMDAEYIRTHGYGEIGRYAMIRVSDDGSGMDDEVRSRIFEPFFTTKEPGRGTGLGLATVYGIVKQHNGYIDVQSERGRGTIFSIYLPLLQCAALQTPKTEEEVIVGGTETILLADDDAAIRSLVARLLPQFGYTVLTASDGEEAVEIFSRNRASISLVILDAIMPGMTGSETQDRIRALAPETTTLFISGYPADTVAGRGMLGAETAFITKPVTPVTLLKKVREVLDLNRRDR